MEGSPLDPETGKQNAGVGLSTPESITPYPIPNPTVEYQKATETGRIGIYCIDLDHTTLVIAVIYGWTGAQKGTATAARTDDLNGTIDCLVLAMLQPRPCWPDVGMGQRICNGHVGQHTCQ